MLDGLLCALHSHNPTWHLNKLMVQICTERGIVWVIKLHLIMAKLLVLLQTMKFKIRSEERRVGKECRR